MRIEEIETQEDFSQKMDEYNISNAPFEAREEAKRKLRATFPEFGTIDKIPNKEILQMIKDGEADIDDIGGF